MTLVQASDSALSSIAVAGDMVACGSEKGDVVLYRVNDVASVAERYEKHVVINVRWVTVRVCCYNCLVGSVVI